MPGYEDRWLGGTVAAPSAYKRSAELRKELRGLAGDLVARLERDLVAQRRITGAELKAYYVAHPLVGPLARRLIWGVYDTDGTMTGAVRILDDGSFVSATGAAVPLPDDALVGVAHPLHLGSLLAGSDPAQPLAQPLAQPAEQPSAQPAEQPFALPAEQPPGQAIAQPAEQPFSRLGEQPPVQPLTRLGEQPFAGLREQPFPQLGREIYRLTAEEAAGRELAGLAGRGAPEGKLIALEKRGWARGAAAGRGHHRHS